MSNNMPPPQQGQPQPTGGGMDYDALVQQALTGVDASGGTDAIGGTFTPGGPFDKFTPGLISDPTMMVRPGGQAEGNRGPGISKAYVQGDEQKVWDSLTLEDRVRLQDDLVSLGLASSAIPGEFDDGTIKGITSVLALSNRSGTTWDSTMGRLHSLEEQGLLDAAAKEQQAFDVPAYLAPDYASIAQDVKTTFRDRLGRDPDQSEMAQLTAELDGWHKGSFDAQVGARRQDFENAQQTGAQTGGTVRQVDPMSRFREAFERKYANELDFVEDKEDAVLSRQVVDSGTSTLSNMSRGG